MHAFNIGSSKMQHRVISKGLLLIKAFVFLMASFLINHEEVRAQAWPADTIHVFINSGNPNFPFPQFNEYNQGKSLALYNPIGVVHAEMEQTTRDAFRIMMNRAIYSGDVLGSGANAVQYIMFNNGVVPQNYGTFVTEGDGYALLAAAYMADKITFDGLWCWIHDNRLSKIKRYLDCDSLRPTYAYGKNTAGWNATETTGTGSSNDDSAADGDYDIALALLVAYRQWGDMMGVNDACGNPISYKQAALDFINGLVQPIAVSNGNPAAPLQYVTGDIGVDGYPKGGNTWGEMTNWAVTNGVTPNPACGFVYSNCNQQSFHDYFAPAYYRAFGDFLTQQAQPAWNIQQFRRAEAASDWIMGQMYAQGYVPFGGGVSMNETTLTPTFSNTSPTGSFDGEAFRLPWRTISNYMWHGPPANNWDPATHQTVPGTNTYELQNANLLASFLKAPQNFPGNVCTHLGNDPTDINFQGNTIVYGGHLNTGAPGDAYIYMNWIHGTASSAAVLSGDTVTLAKTYRQLQLEWDVVNSTPTNDYERYLGSTPKYFHGWFRLLGLMVTTGNWHSPNDMITPVANMKVYKSVSKTYGYPGDTLMYTISYRNYASVAATGVKITDVLPAELNFVSASNGGTYSGGIVTWNIGTVPGFQTATGVAPTQGYVTVICQIKSTVPVGDRFCNISNITCTNGTGWTSNEYPNNITAVMQRNCVDIVSRGLGITKTASQTMLNPGDTTLFTLNFQNSSSAGWLNGGRPGVNLTHAYGYSGPNTFEMYFRIFHGAEEAYIDYGNYRISYYLNATGISGLYPASPNGWSFKVDFLEGGDSSQVNFGFEQVPFGTDPVNGRQWNQRLICQFPHALAAISQHLYKYFGVTGRVHQGVTQPFRTMLQLQTFPSTPMSPILANAWSFNGDTSVMNIGSNDKNTYFPISPDWTDPITYPTGLNVTKIHVDECRTKTPNFNRILVEEFDGYTWRRVFGNGPLPGRETYNVVVTDTIPVALSWVGFVMDSTLGVKATYNAASRIVSWTIPVMLVGSTGTLSYKAKANGTCPMSDNSYINAAWISSQTDSRIGSSVGLTTTCTVLPPPPPAPTTMTKTADKATYAVGDNITYTINYTQSQGTIATDNFATTSKWVAPAGSPGLPTAFSNLNAPYTSSGKYFYENQSHGTNGILTTTIQWTNAWDNLSLLFRYVSGTPGTASFNGVALDLWPGKTGFGGGVEMSVMNGPTLLTNTGTNPILYPSPQATLTISVKLTGGTMQVWINSNPLTTPPMATFTGVLVQAGWVGIYNGAADLTMSGGQSNGAPILQSWNSNFDSAFNLQLSDPIPSGLTFTSASNSGTNTAGVINWPMQAGPVLAGTSYTYTWTGKVTSCPLPLLTNTAYANMVGQVVNSIGAQVTVNCGNVTTPVDFISFTGTTTSGGAVLNWTVANEYNNKGFYVESSSDGINFTSIGFVAGTNQKGTNSYQFTDLQFTGSEYYRIQQVDQNGATKLTQVIYLSSASSDILYVYPNPSNQSFTLRYTSNDDAMYKIFSASGQLVETGTLHTAISTLGADWARGVYTLQLVANDQVVVKKLVKD